MGLIRTPEEQELDNRKMTFGKYTGKTRNEIAVLNPQYIVWMYGTIKDKQTCSYPLAKSCGYVDYSGRDPSARDLPLADRNSRTDSPRIKDHFDSYDDDDDIPF